MARHVLVFLAIGAGVLLTARPAAAADVGFTTCPNERFLDNSPSIGFPVSLDPGIYEVAVSVSDEYPGREFAPVDEQSHEQVRVVVHFEDGRAETGPSPDLEDGVIEATWDGSIGQITAETPVVGIEIIHVTPVGFGANSLNVHCVSLHRVIEIPLFPIVPTAAIATLGLSGYWWRTSK